MTFILTLATAIIPLLTTRMFNDAFTVIKWHAVHVIAIGLLLFLPKAIELPRLIYHRSSWWVAGVLVCASAYSLSRGNAVGIALLDRVSFGIYFICFLQVKNVQWIFTANLFAVIANAIYLVCQMQGYDPLGLLFGSRPTAFLGNPNMLAQFFGLSLLMQLYSSNRYKQLICGGVVGLLYYLGSRSALGGAVLACLVYAAQTRWTKRQWAEFVVSAALIGALFNLSPAATVSQKTAQELGAQAQQSTWEMRKTLWQKSAHIFMQNPFGVGTGNYEFHDVELRVGSKLPNMEWMTYNTPHNEFVRYLVEDGVIYFLCVCVLFWMLFAPAFIRRLPIWIFLGTEFMFQFPMMNAASFFYIAGIMAILGMPPKDAGRVALGKLPFFLACLLVPLVYATIRSAYLDRNRGTELKSMQTACELTPGNWRRCTGYGVLLREARYPLLAKEVFHKELVKRPNNHPVLRQLALTEFLLEEYYEACYHTWLYDRLFAHQSSMQHVFKTYCSHMQSYFEREYDYKKQNR